MESDAGIGRTLKKVVTEVQIPAGETRVNRRWVITGDVWRDGEHLGEIAELLVNMKPMKAH